MGSYLNHVAMTLKLVYCGRGSTIHNLNISQYFHNNAQKCLHNLASPNEEHVLAC